MHNEAIIKPANHWRLGRSISQRVNGRARTPAAPPAVFPRQPAARTAWFTKRPVEELYDVVNDSVELHNRAADPAPAVTLAELRTRLGNPKGKT